MQPRPYIQPQPVQQPVPQPVRTTPTAPYGPSRNYMGLIIGGIVVLLVGGIIFISAGFINDPEDYDEMEDYTDQVRLITTLGSLIEYIGLIILSIGLIKGAVNDNSLHPNVRLGMLIALGLIVGFKIMSFIPWITSI